MSESDSSYMRSACGKLSSLDMLAAEARSRRILSGMNPLSPDRLEALRDELIMAAIREGLK